MKFVGIFIEYAVAIGILTGVIWGYMSFFAWRGENPHSVSFGIAWLVLGVVLYAPIGVIAWRNLRGRVGRFVWLRLCILAGPSWFLALCLVVGLTMQLTSGQTKELMSEARKEHVSSEAFDQWWRDTFQKMESDRLLYAMLAATICVEFWSRIVWATNGRT